MSAQLLETLRDAGHVGDLDLHFAWALARIAGETDRRVVLAAALASRVAGAGHACLDVARLSEGHIDLGGGDAAEGLGWPPADEWLEALSRSRLVGTGRTLAPLVLDDGGLLYLYRHWLDQDRLAREIRRRAAAVPDDLDADLLEEGLARLFSPKAGPDLARAARTAATRRLCVISGGPGTGKTTAVARVLALLAEQSLAAGREPPRVVLVAPTGKAAARLSEAVRRARADLPCDRAVVDAIPDAASTVHRALGYRPDRPDRPARTAEDPLRADVVVVDEASMVPLAPMAGLLEATPPEARAILVGDRHQLASVEPGSILADVCDAGSSGPLEGCVAHLPESFRFGAGSGIDRLATAINAGRADEVEEILGDDAFPDAAILEPRGGLVLRAALEEPVKDGLVPYLSERDPAAKAGLLGRLRILCAHRRGARGVDGVGSMVEDILEGAVGLERRGGQWVGRPVMVVRNDHDLGLFNGDVGFFDADPGSGGALRAFFPAADGSLRAIAPARLPPHETVLATTVHKSQGSEFDRVVLVLPEERSPVVTRELLYTAVTRAREAVTIVGSAKVVREAVASPVRRASGLRRMLS